MKLLKAEETRTIEKLVEIDQLVAHINISSCPFIYLYLTKDIDKIMSTSPGMPIDEITGKCSAVYLYNKADIKQYKQGTSGISELDTSDQFDIIFKIIQEQKQSKYIKNIYRRVGHGDSYYLLDPFNNDKPVYRPIRGILSGRKINIPELKRLTKKNKRITIKGNNNESKIHYKILPKEFYSKYTRYREDMGLFIIDGLPEIKLSTIV